MKPPLFLPTGEGFPHIFISEIIIQLFGMQESVLTLACCSPLPNLVDLLNAAMSETSALSPVVDGSVLITVCSSLILAARVIQKRNMMKGM